MSSHGRLIETLRVRVAFADTDAMGVAWHGSYLRWFEMARTEMMRRTELPYAAMVERGGELIAEGYTEHAFTDAAGRVRRPPREIVEVFTRLAALHDHRGGHDDPER